MEENEQVLVRKKKLGTLQESEELFGAVAESHPNPESRTSSTESL
jgi:hypothetical protein